MNRLVWHPAVRFAVTVAVGVLAVVTVVSIAGWLVIVFGRFLTGVIIVLAVIRVFATLDDHHTRRKP